MAMIMVVDDTSFMRNILRSTLELNGYEVTEATNGVEAVAMFKKLGPDLVTMDISMPEMDGITALAEIIRFNPLAKVIMCSARGQQNMVIEAIQAGAKDFIVKPFQKERVIQSVGNALSHL